MVKRQRVERPVGLKLPFEKMHQQQFEAADEFALLGLAHAFDVLDDMRQVGFLKPARTQQRRLLIGPGLKIALIQRGGAAHGGSFISNRQDLTPFTREQSHLARHADEISIHSVLPANPAHTVR